MSHDLRHRVRAGDHDAFAELFDENARALYCYALRLTGRPADAEDAVSQTFLEAWRLHAAVTPTGGVLRPWLFGIATNVLHNQRRASRRFRTALARLPLPRDTPDIAEQAAQEAGRAAELAAARVALESLHRREREVVAVCVWSGLSYAETAEALGVPIGTVRSRLSRAKARLRRLAEAQLNKTSFREPAAPGGQVRDACLAVGRSVQERQS
jgi:RNA polymerase sigma-70 factor, ECF subfamily